ncbi:type I pantothenate kinase [Salinithrix halophila]|uniref:Pantothenate kinase n=1 Tax=Salinithrix halophila TaxID=1485204 RepID=A0ABV8JJL5_9BACL
MPAYSPFSPYLTFSREEWKALRASVPQTLDEEDLEKLRGINEKISLEEVSDFYLPLSRLLNLLVAQSQDTYRATRLFLGDISPQVPFLIGVSGSVAVGKSTTARLLQALLSRWPHHPRVELVTTDGFLYPNRVLEERGLMHRKGFPESYNRRSLIRFLSDLKSGRPEVRAPVYSHLTYDILPDKQKVVRQPDIVIVEGLNILQSLNIDGEARPTLFASDFLDFSIYVDAEAKDIANWYVDRFQVLRRTAFRDPRSYFRRYADLTEEEATETARGIWREINEVNLVENVLPTKNRARLILEKGPDHSIRRVKLRKL